MSDEKLATVKVFLPLAEKDEYQQICLQEKIKMSADIRNYIAARRNRLSLDVVDEILSLIRASDRPSNAQMVKLARRLGVDTEEIMELCDRLFTKER